MQEKKYEKIPLEIIFERELWYELRRQGANYEKVNLNACFSQFAIISCLMLIRDACACAHGLLSCQFGDMKVVFVQVGINCQDLHYILEL